MIELELEQILKENNYVFEKRENRRDIEHNLYNANIFNGIEGKITSETMRDVKKYFKINYPGLTGLATIFMINYGNNNDEDEPFRDLPKQDQRLIKEYIEFGRLEDDFINSEFLFRRIATSKFKSQIRYEIWPEEYYKGEKTPKLETDKEIDLYIKQGNYTEEIYFEGNNPYSIDLVTRKYKTELKLREYQVNKKIENIFTSLAKEEFNKNIFLEKIEYIIKLDLSSYDN